MTKKPTIQDHARLAEQFNEIVDKCVHLQVDVSNTIGKTKARKMYNNLGKAKETISSIRWELENMMLDKYPKAPLYTSYRAYQGENITVSHQQHDQERRKNQRMMIEIRNMRKPIFSDTIPKPKRKHE